MAFLHVHMESQALHMPVPVSVLLPEYDPDGEHGIPVKVPYKTLYLLHGFRSSEKDWVLNSGIMRFVAKLPLAVVMPAGNNSFYVNTQTGQRYTDYLAWELPKICEDWFDLSHKREDRYIAGFSMGGYGAYHAAMTYPERFAKAASMSGALDISKVYRKKNFTDQAPYLVGPREKMEGGPNDLLALARRLKELPEDEIPRFLSLCGEQDGLWEVNVRFQRYMEELGLPVKLESWEGIHDWMFWDQAIQRILDWLAL